MSGSNSHEGLRGVTPHEIEIITSWLQRNPAVCRANPTKGEETSFQSSAGENRMVQALFSLDIVGVTPHSLTLVFRNVPKH